MRVLLLPFLLCACAVSTEDRRDLAGFQQRAALYYEGGNLGQAMDQIARGLEIDPDDYKLNALQGKVLLLRSAGATSADHARLDQAAEVLRRVYSWRRPERHEPYLLFDLALVLQKQGQVQIAEGLRLASASEREPNEVRRTELLARAEVCRERSRELLGEADAALDVLLTRGDMLLPAQKHRMLIARQLDNDDKYLQATKDYLQKTQIEQEATRRAIEATSEPQFEKEQLAHLQDLRRDEIETRALLATFFMDEQRFQEALTEWDRVLELDPSRVADYYNRGRVHEWLQQEARAKDDFRRFLAASELPEYSEQKRYAAQALQR